MQPTSPASLADILDPASGIHTLIQEIFDNPVDWILIASTLFVAVVIIALSISGYVHSRRRNRLLRQKRTFFLLITGFALLIVGIAGIFIALSLSTGTILGIAGLSETFLVTGATFVYGNITNQKGILFVSKSNSVFSNNILDGLKNELNDRIFKLNTIFPEENNEESLSWQYGILCSKIARRSDAIVIILVGEDNNIVSELRRLMRLGIVVILIDYKIPNKKFYEHGIMPPRFVSSNFLEGGRIISECVQKLLDQTTSLIVLLGPDSSSAGILRSESFLYHLFKATEVERIKGIGLESWNPKAGWEALRGVLERELSNSSDKKPKQVIVYCGNDRILQHCDRQISSLESVGNTKILLIGYDGIRNSDGSYIIGGSKFGVSTIDVKPFEQGQMAGHLINDAYAGIYDDSLKNRIVSPREVTV